jgi:hypothetical protein
MACWKAWSKGNQEAPNIERIAQIKKAVGVFLTLHGGSGTDDEDFLRHGLVPSSRKLQTSAKSKILRTQERTRFVVTGVFFIRVIRSETLTRVTSRTFALPNLGTMCRSI